MNTRVISVESHGTHDIPSCRLWTTNILEEVSILHILYHIKVVKAIISF